MNLAHWHTCNLEEAPQELPSLKLPLGRSWASFPGCKYHPCLHQSRPEQALIADGCFLCHPAWEERLTLNKGVE